MQPLVDYRRGAALLLLVGLVLLVVTLEPVEVATGRIVEVASQFIHRHQRLGLLIFVVLSALSAVAFFLSSTVVVPIAVYTWGKPTTMVLLWGSWLLGAVVSYWLGGHPGRRLVAWIVPGDRVQRYEKTISATASFPLVLLFQVAVPSEIPGLVLGALRYDFGKYMGARAIAEVPFAVGAVYLGDTLVRGQHAALLAIALAGVALSAAALYLLRRGVRG